MPNGTANRLLYAPVTIPVSCGSSAGFTMVPGTCSNVADVLVDGTSQGSVPSYEFAGVQSNHTIAASFSAGVYQITASAWGPGAVEPSGVVDVDCEDDQTFTFTANPNCQVFDVIVDSVSMGPMPSYTFTNVTGNHTIRARFRNPAVPVLSMPGLMVLGWSLVILGAWWLDGRGRRRTGRGGLRRAHR